MLRILLVEDSALQRRAICGWLETDHWAVEGVGTAREALARIESATPDIVVSDLEMHDVGGMELVRQLHERHPRLPVILMTAHGSEEAVVEALRSGAASFILKQEARTLLPETIEHLVSETSTERHYDRLIADATRAAFDFRLDNDPALIQPLVDLLLQMCAGICRLDENERLRAGVAIVQGLHNAMFRGNLEIPGPAAVAAGAAVPDLETRRAEGPYRDRSIEVHSEIDRDGMACTIRDSGPGFDWTAHGEDCEAGLAEDQGRGLVLMRAFMDEVVFEPPGNVVSLRKKAPGNGEPPVAKAHSAPATAARAKPLARLTPVESGPSIEIQKTRIVIGRDRTCDIVIPWPDVSAHHCQMFVIGGWWYVKDLQTKNGVKLNGVPVTRRRVSPGDVLHVAKHRYEVRYDPGDLGAVGVTPPPEPF